jgi:hypothetical protein
LYYLVVSVGSDDPEHKNFDPTETRRFPYSDLEHAQEQRDYDKKRNQNKLVKFTIEDEDGNEVEG